MRFAPVRTGGAGGEPGGKDGVYTEPRGFAPPARCGPGERVPTAPRLRWKDWKGPSPPMRAHRLHSASGTYTAPVRVPSCGCGWMTPRRRRPRERVAPSPPHRSVGGMVCLHCEGVGFDSTASLPFGLFGRRRRRRTRCIQARVRSPNASLQCVDRTRAFRDRIHAVRSGMHAFVERNRIAVDRSGAVAGDSGAAPSGAMHCRHCTRVMHAMHRCIRRTHRVGARSAD